MSYESTRSAFFLSPGRGPSSRRLLGSFACLLLASLVAVPAGAVIQLKNQDLSENLDSWTLSAGGTWAHAPGMGIFGEMGAVDMTSTASGEQSMSQCADVSGRMPGAGVFASGYVRPVNHTSPVAVEVEMFSGANCTGSSVEVGSNTNGTPSMDAWFWGTIAHAIPPAGASSARFTMKVTSTAAGQVTRFAHSLLAENLLRDGHFNEDISQWAVNRGPWVQLTSDGFSEPMGIAQATNEDAWTVMSICDSLASPFGPSSGSVLYIAGAAFKPLDAAEQQRLILEWHEAPDCSGDPLDAPTFFSAPTPPVGQWSYVGSFRLRPPTATSYVLRIGSNSNDAFPATADSRVLWDNVYLVPLNWMTVDGFESGDFGVWSNIID